MKIDIPGFKQMDSCESCNGTTYKECAGGTPILKNCYCVGMLAAYQKLGSYLFKHFMDMDPKDPKKFKIYKSVKDMMRDDKFKNRFIYFNFNEKRDFFLKCLAYYIFSNGIRRFIVIDVYRVMDIYLGNDSEFKTPRNLIDSHDLVVVEMGKTEIQINRFDETVKQFIYICEAHNSCKLWFASSHSRDSSYIRKYYMDHTYEVINSPMFINLSMSSRKKA